MAGSVAVGPATRAYRETGGQGVFTQMPGGSVATGSATRAARVGVPAPFAQPGPWTPPAIPSSYYNPIRGIEDAEGARGSEQTISGLQRQKTDAENDYGTSVTQVESHGKELQERLAESYKKLGAAQDQQANTDGTLYGGALMASAMKRATNEGVQKAANQKAEQDELGKLSVSENELLGPGGSLTEALQNAGVNQQGFHEGIQTLEGTEAASNGYQAPTAPKFDKVNPVNGEHYRRVTIGGKQYHEYHSGRKVPI